MSTSNDAPPPVDPQPTKPQHLGLKWLKLLIADHARGMANNQRSVNEGLQKLAEDGDYERRLNNAVATQRFGDKWDTMQDPEKLPGDDMDIRIDSPTTVNYLAPQPPQPEAPEMPAQPPPVTTTTVYPPPPLPSYPPSAQPDNRPWLQKYGPYVVGALAGAAIPLAYMLGGNEDEPPAAPVPVASAPPAATAPETPDYVDRYTAVEAVQLYQSQRD